MTIHESNHMDELAHREELTAAMKDLDELIIETCVGCEDPIDIHEQPHHSYTLDGPLCLGCAQDGDNP